MSTNPDKQQHPSLQFLVFIALTFGIIFAGYLIGAAIVMILYGVNTVVDLAQLNLANPNAVTGLWILQIVSTTIPIIVSSLIFAYWIVKSPQEYLKQAFKFPLLLPVIVFFVMLTSSPLIEILSNINQKMVLPHFLDGVQRWMRQSEDQAKKLTDVLLQMKTISSMLLKLLVVGLLTAIVEEFMFRGVIQTIFTKWTKNPHAAIWITAALFSAFHMEFFGFLPRMFLGVLFGYFVVWSGSIWTSVWAHFINNGTVVIVTYLYQNQRIKVNPDDQHIFNYGSYVFSLIIVLFLLYLYRTIAMGKVKMPVL
ncbi:CPBP family intramembrane metalloprotease [Mucilaginibacter corticis]|uniref:CPBP family intramembrane metalloprotease n=1 Tax=Mucilaginibacter corticis TaxID=2597670 RepID=A0A556MUM3_9SPHI|nr:CPBP family intramembrane glutamic endopeptidase [Mucilaginibacter corticis]TSJ43634.1 CPBP family intramembrane metalloprotease [Mucilaginibacter corticis]